MTAPYLERIKITAFGAFSNKIVGPFTPNLNVVFGGNEAGKTTLASFVGGVLFGWEEARGNRNTYKPEVSERSGSLFFVSNGIGDCSLRTDWAASTDDLATSEVELSRTKNVDGLQGCASLVADIDKETFRTMFSLTSDELRSLRNTTDVTAKLLTAGSGTGASPALALAKVQERLVEYTSRASGIEHSLVNLNAEQDALREKIARSADEVERLRKHDKEFHELAPQRDELLSRLNSLNADIETLTSHRATLEKLDQEISSLGEQIKTMRNEEAALEIEHRVRVADATALVDLGAAEERVLRDQIESLAVGEAKSEHAVDLAKDNYASSKAAYEALLETEDTQAVKERARRQRRVQVALSIVLPLVFVFAGVPLFIHGREITSLSFTALGVGLVVIAVILAAAALVMLFKPDKEADAKEARKKDTQWVMLQDKKKLEACLQSQVDFKQQMRAQLDAAGLVEASGSLRRARTLLDEAKEARAESNLFHQRQQALVSRRTALEESYLEARTQRRRLFDRVDGHGEHTLEALDAALAQKSQQRAALMETSERLNRRYGELKQELSSARRRREFDALKLRCEQVRTRLDESSREYARLLLAKRMLETSVAAWESKSQPEVYRHASRLLHDMTDGRWVKVAMTSDGRLQVTDAVRTVREPIHLSLGTCQQLYLALRIALLMAAENVGRAIPVLADDILVNFDATRRAGAARALASLATMRQVVLFTCHEEIVETMVAADPTLNKVVL